MLVRTRCADELLTRVPPAVYIGDTVKNMPYLVAIDCKVPPPSQLAHHSLQAGKCVPPM